MVACVICAVGGKSRNTSCGRTDTGGSAYGIETLGAVVTHDVSDVQLLVITVLMSCRIRVMRLVLLIVEALVVQLAYTPKGHGYNEESYESNCYIHNGCLFCWYSCYKVSEFLPKR